MRILKNLFKNGTFIFVAAIFGLSIGIAVGATYMRIAALDVHTSCTDRLFDKKRKDNMKKFYGHSDVGEMGNVYNHAYIYKSFLVYKCFKGKYLYE